VELQRSIDVWERSWPELPLARLYVITAEHGPEVATLIQRELGQRTVALDPLAAFAPDAPPPEGDARAALAACLPLLGAALRTETRKL
jgi:MSHA biogenesis protein MshI